jgi:hypothetical protein
MDPRAAPAEEEGAGRKKQEKYGGRRLDSRVAGPFRSQRKY